MNPHLDIRQLQAFLAIAEGGSFTLAASELRLTQSAISHSIRSLETQLSCQLLQRKGREVTLTHQGRLLLSRAKQIQKQVTMIHAELCAPESSPAGILNIACTSGASQHLLPKVVKAFRKRFPLYELRVIPGESHDTVARVLNGEADLGLSLKPETHSQLQCHFLFEDHLGWLIGNEHPLASIETVTPEHISRHTLLVSNRVGSTFKLISTYLLENNIQPKAILEMGSVEACKELARIGLGIAVCAPWIAAKELEQETLLSLQLGSKKLKRHWVVTTLTSRTLHPAEMHFIQLCQQNVPSMTSHAATG